MSELTTTGLVFTSFMILLAIFTYVGKRINQREEIGAKDCKNNLISELRDVEIILQDGTLYERYENVLLTHFSPRVYQLHTLRDRQKELLVKIHLGEEMMLKAVVSAQRR